MNNSSNFAITMHIFFPRQRIRFENYLRPMMLIMGNAKKKGKKRKESHPITQTAPIVGW